MKPFNFLNPITFEEALTPNIKSSKFLAGGTNLVDLLKRNIEQPDNIFNLNNLDISNKIEIKNNSISIGALAKNSDVANNQLIEEYLPLINKTILAGASQQIRNMATVGGNILQKTRCPYFYDITAPCNKRIMGAGCSALLGESRLTALVGYDKNCIAVFPSDFAVSLATFDANIFYKVLESKKIILKKIPINQFYSLEEKTNYKDNLLPYNSIITHIEIPINSFNKNFSYVKIRDRDLYAFALVSVALEIKENIIVDARICSGGIAHKPWRWLEAENYLKNKPINLELFKKVSGLIIESIQSPKNSQFKIPLLRGAIESALIQAVG